MIRCLYFEKKIISQKRCLLYVECDNHFCPYIGLPNMHKKNSFRLEINFAKIISTNEKSE